MLKEFKAFALKGNVIDLAVAVIIGGAFGKIVSSLVNEVIMPVIGVVLGGVSFTDLKYVITPASGDIAEAPPTPPALAPEVVLPDDQIKALIEGVKAKVSLEQAGGLLGSIKKLF